jgi:hypothetical protein
MAATTLPQAITRYNSDTQSVTYEEYCGPQLRLGVPDNVCRIRYDNYINKMRQGLGQRWAAGYTGQG